MNNNIQGANGVPPLTQANDNELFFIGNAINLDGLTQNPPADSPAPTNALGQAQITGLPAQAPAGGYTNAFNAVVSFDWNGGANAQRWVFQRLIRANPDAAYVNVTGDTMTGNLVMDDDPGTNDDVGIHLPPTTVADLETLLLPLKMLVITLTLASIKVLKMKLTLLLLATIS